MRGEYLTLSVTLHPMFQHFCVRCVRKRRLFAKANALSTQFSEKRAICEGLDLSGTSGAMAWWYGMVYGKTIPYHTGNCKHTVVDSLLIQHEEKLRILLSYSL